MARLTGPEVLHSANNIECEVSRFLMSHGLFCMCEGNSRVAPIIVLPKELLRGSSFAP